MFDAVGGLRFVAASVLVLGALAAMTACERNVDATRATICRRTLPAIAPRDVQIHVLKVGFGDGANTVRIDFGISGRPEIEKRSRHVVCGFAGADLISLVTDDGPIGEAALYLLKRYYLATREAVLSDPGR